MAHEARKKQLEQVEARLKALFAEAEEPEVRDAWQAVSAWGHYAKALQAFDTIAGLCEAEDAGQRNQDAAAFARILNRLQEKPLLALAFRNHESAFVNIADAIDNLLEIQADPERQRLLNLGDFLKQTLAYPNGFLKTYYAFGGAEVLAAAGAHPEGMGRLLYQEEQHWSRHNFRGGHADQDLWQVDRYGPPQYLDYADSAVLDHFAIHTMHHLWEAQKLTEGPPATLSDLAGLPPTLLWAANFAQMPLLESAPGTDGFLGWPEDELDAMMEEEQRRQHVRLTPLGTQVVAAIATDRDRQRRTILQDVAHMLGAESIEEQEDLSQKLVDHVATLEGAEDCERILRPLLRSEPAATRADRIACARELPRLLRMATPDMLRELSLEGTKLVRIMPEFSTALIALEALPPPNSAAEREARDRHLQRHLFHALDYATHYNAAMKDIDPRSRGLLIEFEPDRLETVLWAQDIWANEQARMPVKNEGPPPLVALCRQLQSRMPAGQPAVSLRETLAIPTDLFAALLLDCARDHTDGKRHRERLRKGVDALMLRRDAPAKPQKPTDGPPSAPEESGRAARLRLEDRSRYGGRG